jgi:hypothetical protein
MRISGSLAVGHIDLSQHIALFPWNVKRRLCLQLGLGRSRDFVHDRCWLCRRRQSRPRAISLGDGARGLPGAGLRRDPSKNARPFRVAQSRGVAALKDRLKPFCVEWLKASH